MGWFELAKQWTYNSIPTQLGILANTFSLINTFGSNSLWFSIVFSCLIKLLSNVTMFLDYMKTWHILLHILLHICDYLNHILLYEDAIKLYL
jgi:hypothetical protein